MLRALPALLKAQVEGEGHEFIRSSFIGFGPSSLDFELVVDVHSDDYNDVIAARTEIGIRLFEELTPRRLRLRLSNPDDLYRGARRHDDSALCRKRHDEDAQAREELTLRRRGSGAWALCNASGQA